MRTRILLAGALIVAVLQLADAAKPGPLMITCPENVIVSTTDPNTIVTYPSAKVTGSKPPYSVTYLPPSGSVFPAGATTVNVTAIDRFKASARCAFTVTVNQVAPIPPPPPPTTGNSRGPQSTIICPAGAVDIWPGSSIAQAVTANAGGTSFCLRAGIFYLTGSITPKSGDTFTGEYGAVLDGSGWITTDTTQAAFRSHLQDIDRVTIRNLTIQNMPQRAIHTWHDYSDGWTVEYVEVTNCHGGAISLPNSSVLRHSYVHHNTGDSQGGLIPNGGYIVSLAHDVLFEDNDISYNGETQKVVDNTQNVTFRNNWVHHNLGSGIWYDGDNTGILIENNTVEDNGADGVIIEISGQAIVRSNTIRRSGENGIFLSTSQNADIYQNRLEENFRSVNLFAYCPAVGGGSLGWDLANNSIHDNDIYVGSQAGVMSSAISASGSCAANYDNTSKNNQFRANRYYLPTVTAPVWYWEASKTFNEWQALGQDGTSTVAPR